MSIEKSELKMLIAGKMGRDLEDLRDRGERDVYRHQGATAALQTAENKINKITQEVKDELLAVTKDGKEPPFDPTDMLEVGKYIVGRVMTCASVVHGLADKEAASALRAEGTKHGLDQAVKQIFRVYEEEKSKLESFAKLVKSGQLLKDGDEFVFSADEDDPKAPRPVGTHPGPPLKAVRQAEVATTLKKVKAASKKTATKPKTKRSGKKADAENS
jgi:hypothetical protein